jgi:hypothetical protein
MAASPLEQVLANIVPGRGQRLRLNEKQRRGLKDRDGRIALQVLRALLRARRATGQAATFPLTEDALQAIAAKLGHKVGDKRARAIIKRCAALGVTEDAGSYRQTYKASASRSGFRVPLFRLRVASARLQASVGKRPLVKRSKAVRWWAHPLFGEPNGRPPPQLGLRAASRMRSIDELETPLRFRLAASAQ